MRYSLSEEEQNAIIKDYKNKRFQVVQLQTEIDDKNRIIKRLRDDNAGLSGKLQSQIIECENVADDLLKDFIGVLDTCEYARYAPGSNSDAEMDKVYAQSMEVIMKLDKSI